VALMGTGSKGIGGGIAAGGGGEAQEVTARCCCSCCSCCCCCFVGEEAAAAAAPVPPPLQSSLATGSPRGGLALSASVVVEAECGRRREACDGGRGGREEEGAGA